MWRIFFIFIKIILKKLIFFSCFFIQFVDNLIKPFVLGRKNWLFAGSEDGARSSCLLFSLIECAKIHNINPEDYLRCIFEQAADTDGWTEDDWKQLLPWNIKITSFEPQGVWTASQGAQN